ncbi:MAG TPA: serine/threonine-protein kinase [Polyangiaceae bacterium]|jgi:serine/threonine-protein kinase
MASGEAAKSTPRTVGRYVVYGEIASGGMATVHFGRLTGAAGFARSVAIKRLHAHYARDPEFVKMFLDEARLAARINHPNVVSTLDVVAVDDDLFLVMDYVRGASLSQLARTVRHANERIPPLVATGIVTGVLHGLDAAHEAKDEAGARLDIVHRDVSPQNILVGTDGVARLLDFGVAKAAGRLQTTRDGQLKGKLAYMAPEQIRGTAVTRRTDVYAAAVVLWEALTGERLFKGENEANVMARVLNEVVPPPSSVVPSLPRALDPIVLRALQREPGERYATAREMAHDLAAAVGTASPPEIGDWVERVAARELQDRAGRLAEIERGALDAGGDEPTSVLPSAPGRGAPDAPTPVGRREMAETTGRSIAIELASQASGVSVAHPTMPPPERRPRARMAWIGAAVGAGIAAVVATVVFALGEHAAPAPAPLESATPAAAPAGAPAPVATPAPAPAPTAAAATAEPSAAPSPPAEVPVVSVSALPSAAPTAPASPPTLPPPRAVPAAVHPRRADCDPPYTTDAKGHVHFKPQCM